MYGYEYWGLSCLARGCFVTAFSQRFFDPRVDHRISFTLFVGQRVTLSVANCEQKAKLLDLAFCS
jgi:hypothetical protein